MVHLRYYRSERDRKDHVILFLPDISNTPGLMPTADAYRALVEDTFPAQLQHKLAAIDAETFAPQSDAAKKVHALNEAKAAADEAAKAAADEAAAAAAEAEAAAAAADEEAKAAAANATAENAAPTDTAAATEGDTTANTDAAATTGDVAAAADAADTTTDIATAEETSGGDAAAVEEPVKEEPSAAAEEPSAEPMDATSAKQPDDTNKIDEAAVAADAAEVQSGNRRRARARACARNLLFVQNGAFTRSLVFFRYVQSFSLAISTLTLLIELQRIVQDRKRRKTPYVFRLKSTMRSSTNL